MGIVISSAYPRDMYEGELVQTTNGRWITKPPSRCRNGHDLGPNQVLVGHVACLGHGGGGHTSWHCRTCDSHRLRATTRTDCSHEQAQPACGLQLITGLGKGLASYPG